MGICQSEVYVDSDFPSTDYQMSVFIKIVRASLAVDAVCTSKNRLYEDLNAFKLLISSSTYNIFIEGFFIGPLFELIKNVSATPLYERSQKRLC